MRVYSGYSSACSTHSGLATTSVGVHVDVMVASDMFCKVLAKPLKGGFAVQDKVACTVGFGIKFPRPPIEHGYALGGAELSPFVQLLNMPSDSTKDWSHLNVF